jgi:hypothetical protein
MEIRKGILYFKERKTYCELIISEIYFYVKERIRKGLGINGKI